MVCHLTNTVHKWTLNNTTEKKGELLTLVLQKNHILWFIEHFTAHILFEVYFTPASSAKKFMVNLDMEFSGGIESGAV